VPAGTKEIPLVNLLGEIATARDVARDDLLVTRRGHIERDVAMYLCREAGQSPLWDIAELFGVKYPAVSLACKRVRDTASGNTRFAKQFARSKQAIINRLKTQSPHDMEVEYMRNLHVTTALLVLAVGLAGAAPDEPKGEIDLPAPRTEGGRPLMAALKQRQTTRAYSPKPLPAQVLSDLLWAAWGINRPESGKRTAPSALNWQEIDMYVVLPEGSYIYDAKAHSLRLVVPGDLRAQTGTQAFAATAPLNLVFAADVTRMKGAPPALQEFYYAADTGFISQNVYLFCASEGLGTVVRGLVDRETLAKALNLPEHCKIVFAQSVGYPATE
jgi:nitroreductase